jgi:hypothetical protein
MAGSTTYLSVITLNANGLTSLIKKHILADWLKTNIVDNHSLPTRNDPH